MIFPQMSHKKQRTAPRRLHHPVLNAACLNVVRSAGTHVLFTQNKSDKKFQIPYNEELKNRCFSDFMGYL